MLGRVAQFVICGGSSRPTRDPTTGVNVYRVAAHLACLPLRHGAYLSLCVIFMYIMAVGIQFPLTPSVASLAIDHPPYGVSSSVCFLLNQPLPVPRYSHSIFRLVSYSFRVIIYFILITHRWLI